MRGFVNVQMKDIKGKIVRTISYSIIADMRKENLKNKEGLYPKDSIGAFSHLPTCRSKGYFFFNLEARYCSSAATIEGVWGCGAIISSLSPAS